MGHAPRPRPRPDEVESQSLLRQGVALAPRTRKGSGGRAGLNPFFVRAWPWPRRGSGKTARFARLNPFFVRAWPWPPSAKRSTRSIWRLNPFFVRAWPWPGHEGGSGLRRRVSIPSSSGRGLGRGACPTTACRSSLNPFFVRAWPWPVTAPVVVQTAGSQSLLRQGVALAHRMGEEAHRLESQSLLRQGVALAERDIGDMMAFFAVSIPSSSGRGLGPRRARRQATRVRSQSLLRQGVALALTSWMPWPWLRGLNPFFVRAWPWPRAGRQWRLPTRCLNPFFVRAWPWPVRFRLERPSVQCLNPFFVRAWPWPFRWRCYRLGQWSQSLLRQGVALASMCPSDEAYSYVSIPSSSGRGLGPTTEGNETWPFVSIPSSSGRGLGPVAVCGNPRVRQGLNPFFVRAWPWPGYARHSRRVGRLNPFFVRAWPWPPTPRGACSRPIPVSIPSSSGRGLGR